MAISLLSPSFAAETSQQYPRIFADKQKGTLTVYLSDTDLRVTPALYGVRRGNVVTNNVVGITPSGHFSVKLYFSSTLHEPVLVFLHTDTIEYSIHPVYLGNPKQRRDERLVSGHTNDKRITNGCINVPRQFFVEILAKLPDGTTLEINRD